MRCLVTGLGSAGQRHVRNLRRLRPRGLEMLAWRVRGFDIVIDEQLTAVPGRRPEAEYDLLVVDDLAAGLARRPDAVIVTNPIAFHLDTALAAVRAGCHVFIEKPLGNRWDGVEELRQAVRAQGLVGCVGYQTRFHPMMALVKQCVADGRIGRIVSARLHFGEYLPGAHPYEDYREGHTARREQGGGVVLALSHELDMAQWLFGMPDRVYATGGRLSSLEIDVEDTASIILECRYDGRRLPVAVYLDFVQRPPTRNGEIVGEDGTVRWDHQHNMVTWYNAAAQTWKTESFGDFRRNDLFLAEMENFLGAIEGKEDIVVPIEEGAKALKIALAALESMEYARPVAIAP